jgi:hypothetical protein
MKSLAISIALLAPVGVLICTLGNASGAAGAAEGAGLQVSPPVRVTGESPYPAACPNAPYPDTEVEFSLATDRRHPRRLVGAWIQDRPRAVAVAYSRDGGRAWRAVLPPALADCTGSEYLRSSDPWLSVGPTGVAYLVSIAVPANPLPFAESAIQVSRSPDMGRTWSSPVFVDRPTETTQPDDKPALTADPHRPGSVYVSWSAQRVEATPAGTFIFNRIEFSRSRDGGRTWSAPAAIDNPPVGWTDGPPSQILVPRRGELLCVFSRRELAENHVLPLVGGRLRFYATRSRDGGRHWTRPIVIGRGRVLRLEDAETATPIRSAMTDVFSAASGADRRVYFAWTDVLSGDDSRIRLAHSRNGGRDWSHPRSVAKAADRPLNPDLAVAGSGAVALRFYDLRADEAGDAPLSTRAWLRVSSNGRRFSRERALGGLFDLRTAPVATGLTPGRFLGEYQGLVGLRDAFGVLFAQAAPQAQIGATDGFFSRAHLINRGRRGRDHR